MRGDKAEERRKGVASSMGGCQWCLSLPLAARRALRCAALGYRIELAQAAQAALTHAAKLKNRQAPYSLPLALRHNGPWRDTTVEFNG